MKDDLFSFLGGLKKQPDYKLKDRMKTTILKVKEFDKLTFMKMLAEDYIRISKELEWNNEQKITKKIRFS